MDKCLVLLCTYNGERYIREQIDSILRQKDVEITIKVSDDISNDNTITILEEYKNKYGNFSYSVNEKNKNFTYNFIDLIFSASDEYDYYALADQDDCWLDNKISEAIKKIKTIESENGVLYSSSLRLVDKNLNEYGKQVEKPNLPRYSYLLRNIGTGCTFVFDKKFLLNVKKHYPKDIYLHDYWLLLIAAYTAKYYYDTNSYILYRVHGDNQVGSDESFITKKKLKTFIKPAHPTSKLVKELYLEYKDEIYKKDLKYIKMAGTYKDNIINRIKLLFSLRIRRVKFGLANLSFKIRVLLGKY